MTTFTDVLGTHHVVYDEMLGLFGATNAGGTESAPQSPGTAGSSRVVVILGTDNGFIVRRYGANDYRLVYADNYAPGTNPRSSAPNGPGPHVYRSLQLEQLSWIVSTNRCIALCEDEFSGGKYAGFLNSLDNGKTWQRSDGGGSPGDPPPMDDNNLAIGLNGETSPVDEDGRIWDLRVSIDSGPQKAFFTSTDYGISWTEQFLQNTPGGVTHWVSDGYIWGVKIFMGLAGSPLQLYRISPVNGVTVTYNFAWPGGFTSFNQSGIIGNYAAKRLFIWGWTPQNLTHYLNVDVTDPDNPSGTWIAYSTISGYSPGKNIIGWAPVTNQKIVMVANNPTFGVGGPNTGAIFYSSDGGFTWTRVVDYTPKLSYIATLGDPGSILTFGVFEETPRLSTDGHNVCVAAVPPDVFISTDEGATWTNETMDMNIFAGQAGIGPTHFLSTAIVGPEGNFPPPPAEARRIPQVTLIGAT